MNSDKAHASKINNEFYNDLGERWYTAKADPVALLRAESRLRNPWVIQQIEKYFGNEKCTILDLGCGAGFLSNELAKVGHRVTGVDLSRESLAVAQQYDRTKSVQYEVMNATQLTFQKESFDIVCAMDFLEHVSEPKRVFQEASRILRKNGLFFFHTFNRNWVSRLIVIKGVEWFVKNTPRNMHIYELFIKPSEVKRFCQESELEVLEMRGVQPRILTTAFWRMLFSGEVGEDFQFTFSSNTLTGYLGIARKFIVDEQSRPD